MPKELIDDDRLFPRSEYYTRFEGTTAFLMTNPDYWGTYHRSVSTRFSKNVGQNVAKFSSFCAEKPKTKANSFYAHTGSIMSPFSNEDYREVIELTKQAAPNNINVRDKLLTYKRRMAEEVLASFEKKVEENSQKIKQGRSKRYIERPIVIYENNYPCVLVSLPVLNPAEAQTEAAAYWAKHPKPFQRLLLASFVAILNVEAKKAGIPIEMVIRASFGHNLPSVCETDNTFRINVGLIPGSYAKLIGNSLEQLNETFNDLTDESALKTPFDDTFLAKVRRYNAKKLKAAIDKNDRYVDLRETRDYKKAEQSDEAFEKLYEKFCDINSSKQSNKTKTKFTKKMDLVASLSLYRSI